MKFVRVNLKIKNLSSNKVILSKFHDLSLEKQFNRVIKYSCI